MGISLLLLGIYLSFHWGSTGWGYAGSVIWESPLFWELRLPRTLMAISAGSGLALAGWMMQTLFRNPLASPSILGVTNGASLGVAIATMIAVQWGYSATSWAIIMASGMGASLILLILGLLRKWMSSVTSLLIFGVMLGHIAGSLETIFQQWADRSDLAGLIYWSMGSFDKSNFWNGAWVFITLIIVGFWIWRKSNELDAWVMGEDFARSYGISSAGLSNRMMLGAGILTAVITTFCGPIAFIGLAAPHLTKGWVKERNHRGLIWGVMLTGALLGLYCDILVRLFHVPLNAVTSLIGAPWVMWWMLKKGRHEF